MYTSGGCCTELSKTLAIWVTTCGAIASTAGVGLSLPPVAPADVPAIFHPRVRDIYLRWGRNVYLRCFWCLPPVVSPTLGGSRFEYTSGGSCGRACNTRPRIWTSTCGATINYTFFPKNCILFKRRTQNVRLMYYLCSVNTK